MMRFNRIVLGGKYAYRFRYGIYALPALIFGTAVSESKPWVDYQFWRWSAAAFMAVMVSFIALLFLDRTVFVDRFKNPKPNSWVFLLGFFLGAIKGFFTGVIGVHFLDLGPISVENLMLRTVSAGFIGFLALPILALASYSWDNLHNARKDLLLDLQGLQEIENLVPSTTSESPSSKERSYLEYVQNRIQDIRDSFEVRMENRSSKSGEQIARELREIANELVRPLSHEAADRASKTLSTRIPTRQLILLLPQTIATSLPWYLAINAATGRLHLQVFGFRIGLLTIAFDTFTFYIAIQFIRFLLQRIKTNYYVVLIIPSVILAIRSRFLFFILNQIHSDSGPVPYLPNAIWSIFMFYLVSLSFTYLVVQLRNINNLESEYAQKYFEILRRDQTDHMISSQLARYLHGTLQTRLIASAFRIKSASESGSEDDIRRELEAVLHHFEIPDFRPQEESETDLSFTLQRIVDQWNGLLQIETSVVGEVHKLRQAFVIQVGEFINEGLSNALRHGGADKVQLMIEYSATTLHLRLEDNGTQEVRHVPGLGTAQFNRIADQGWKLIRDSTRMETVLTADITIPR